MKRFVFLPWLAGATLVLSALTGCLNLKPASDPTRFYLLTVRCPEPTNRLSAAASEAPLLMLGRVEVADYLQRPEMVWRMTPNHIEYASLDQWGEPLASAVNRVLKENLLNLLGPERFFTGTNPADRPTHEIRFEVLQFDLTPAGEARVRAYCRLIDHRSRKLLKQQLLVATRTFDRESQDHTVMAAAFSEALADLSRQIVALAQP